MKKVIMASVALVAICLVLAVFVRTYMSRKELDCYDRTVDILNGLTMKSESNLTNVLYDTWGHAMRISRDDDCWSVVSLGHDAADASDDIVMKWNPRLGQISIDFEYDGQMRSYSITEEHDN